MDMQFQAEDLSGLHNRGHFLQSRGWNTGSKRVSEVGASQGLDLTQSFIYQTIN